MPSGQTHISQSEGTDRLCDENVVWGRADMSNETRKGDE